ncbi:MAG: membrane dipeptidase [Anaerolineae bacterium]|nr:membrane dipeptidase [Anaerolineae bacterium]
MIIVDAHEDIAFNALSWGRDYFKSALEKRRAEADTEAAAAEGLAMVGLPEAILGRVGLVFATIFTEPDRSTALATAPFSGQRYRTAKEANAQGMQQLDYYRRLWDASERVQPVRTQVELDAVLSTWADGLEVTDRKQGMLLLMENADPILEPKQFEEWYDYGVRVVGPAWASTRYCGGTGEPGPLTALGRELLDVMGDMNVLLDLSHMPEESFFEALDRYDGQMIASHSNPRRFVGSRDDGRQRLLSDTQIRRLAERDGVIGMVPYNRFMHPDWVKGDAPIPASRVLDMIDHVCQITGSDQHVGIGTDFDGGFGADSTPEGFDTVGDLWMLDTWLRERGYGDAGVEAILSGNFLRKLRQTLPVR